MRFAIFFVVVCGVVSATPHDGIHGTTSLKQTKHKRSVFGGFPYAHGYHVPIEPMSMAIDRTFERAPDSYLETYYQPEAAYWNRYYKPTTTTTTTAKPTAFYSRRPDSVYRTLMQRAATDSNADAPDRRGNVAIQLTANLVYGYRPSDVAEPVVFPRVEASVRFADESRRRPAVPAASKGSGPESAVIVVALSSDPSSPSENANDDDATAAAAAVARPSADGYDRLLTEYGWLPGPVLSDRYDEPAVVTQDPLSMDAFWKTFFRLAEASGTASEADPSENKIDPVFDGFAETAPTTTTTMAPTDDAVPETVTTPAGEPKVECYPDWEDCSQSTTTENRPEMMAGHNTVECIGKLCYLRTFIVDDKLGLVEHREIVCDEDEEECGSQKTSTENRLEIVVEVNECVEGDDDCGSLSTTTENQPEGTIETKSECDEDDEDCDSPSTTTESQPEETEETVDECDEDDDDCAPPSTTTESTTLTTILAEENKDGDDGDNVENIDDKWPKMTLTPEIDTTTESVSTEITIAPAQEEDSNDIPSTDNEWKNRFHLNEKLVVIDEKSVPTEATIAPEPKGDEWQDLTPIESDPGVNSINSGDLEERSYTYDDEY